MPTLPPPPILKDILSNRVTRSATNPTFSPTRRVGAPPSINRPGTAKVRSESDAQFLTRMSSPRIAPATARTNQIERQQFVRSATNTTASPATARKRISPQDTPTAGSSSRTVVASKQEKPLPGYGVTQYKVISKPYNGEPPVALGFKSTFFKSVITSKASHSSHNFDCRSTKK